MLKCYIDNKEYNLEYDYTVLQLCLKNNISIPRFCYHEKLSIAGNCRMCLVEVEKFAKPVASCAMSLVNNMRVLTNTVLVKKARENVLEFLLANHPLDCPICDQGGECDLQDQAMFFGGDRGRFYEFKRATVNKNIGPLVKTVMTRCIHCTRCIRFLSEVAGTKSFGTTGRGIGMEVGTYIDRVLNTELSGNLIDLCPVGALTSKPYAFTARPWELSSTQGIDVLDSLGSNLKIDFRGTQVLRVLPLSNFLLNEDWITDKVRYVYDGLKNQRLVSPMIKSKNKVFFKVSWLKVFTFLKAFIDFSKLNFVFGNLIEAELALLVKFFANSFGSSSFLGLQNYTSSLYNTDLGFVHFFNNSLINLDSSDLILLLNCNLRLEAPLVNTRLRKNYLRNNVLIVNFGSGLDLNYYYKSLGSDSSTLLSVIEGRHWLCKALLCAKKPFIIVGSSFFETLSSQFLLDWIKSSNNNLNILNIALFNVLMPFSANLNVLQLGLLPGVNFYGAVQRPSAKISLYYLLGADEFKSYNLNDFFIYQGHHGDKMAKKSDVILPGFSFFEKVSTYLNLQGFSQSTSVVALPSKGQVRNDWKILMSLLLFVKKAPNLSFKVSTILSNIKILLYKHSFRFKTTYLPDFDKQTDFFNFLLSNKSADIFSFGNYTFFPFVKEYYSSDSVTRSSSVLSIARSKVRDNFFNFGKNLD